MIDFHTHILPRIDDGSKNVQESLEMLKMLYEQGVDEIIATPHFYADYLSLNEFLAERQRSFESLNLSVDYPKIHLGAEVLYFDGIRCLKEDIKKLCIDNTNLLLLEMPESVWSERIINELKYISNIYGIKIIIAHIERCMFFQEKGVLEDLIEEGFLMQSNADFFIKLSSRRKALKFLKKGYISFIGSDCHGINNRPPNLNKAFNIMKKSLGSQFTEFFDNRIHYLINNYSKESVLSI